MKCRTFKMELKPPVEVRSEELPLPVALVDEKQLLHIDAVPVKYELKKEKIETTVIKFFTKPVVGKVDVREGFPKKMPTHKYKIKPPAKVDTRTISVKFDNMEGRVKRIECRPPKKVETFKSIYLDHAPISREALDRKRIPFPMMSDFMSELAKKHKVSYTNVKFIGAFDPIPLHFAEKLTIDTEMGILKFHVRKEPKKERRFARMVYGRRRDTGEIISAVFPVT